MRFFLLIVFAITLQTPTWAQSINDTSGVLTYAEKMPEFNGDLKMFARSQPNPDTSGRVVIKFIVDEQGGVSHVSVAKSLLPKLDSQALQIVKQLPPAWLPGRNNGKAVAVWAMLPIDFYKKTAYTEKMPEPPVDFSSFIKRNLRYPYAARRKHVEGTVLVKFVVDSTGTVKDLKVIRSVEPSLDNEALRLISMLPRWKPGEQNGHKVAVYFTLPIVFREDDFPY